MHPLRPTGEGKCAILGGWFGRFRQFIRTKLVDFTGWSVDLLSYWLTYFALFFFVIPFPGRPDIWLTGQKSTRQLLWNNAGSCFLDNFFHLARWWDSPPRDKPEQKWYAQWAVQNSLKHQIDSFIWGLDASFVHTGDPFLIYSPPPPRPQWHWSWQLCLLQTMIFTGTFILVNNSVVSLL